MVSRKESNLFQSISKAKMGEIAEGLKTLPLDVVDGKSRTPLQYALELGNEAVIEHILMVYRLMALHAVQAKDHTFQNTVKIRKGLSGSFTRKDRESIKLINEEQNKLLKQHEKQIDNWLVKEVGITPILLGLIDHDTTIHMPKKYELNFSLENVFIRNRMEAIRKLAEANGEKLKEKGKTITISTENHVLVKQILQQLKGKTKYLDPFLQIKIDGKKVKNIGLVNQIVVESREKKTLNCGGKLPTKGFMQSVLTYSTNKLFAELGKDKPDTQLIDKLIQQLPADVVDKKGKTPLHIIAERIDKTAPALMQTLIMAYRKKAVYEVMAEKGKYDAFMKLSGAEQTKEVTKYKDIIDRRVAEVIDNRAKHHRTPMAEVVAQRYKQKTQDGRDVALEMLRVLHKAGANPYATGKGSGMLGERPVGAAVAESSPVGIAQKAKVASGKLTTMQKMGWRGKVGDYKAICAMFGVEKEVQQAIEGINKNYAAIHNQQKEKLSEKRKGSLNKLLTKYEEKKSAYDRLPPVYAKEGKKAAIGCRRDIAKEFEKEYAPEVKAIKAQIKRVRKEKPGIVGQAMAMAMEKGFEVARAEAVDSFIKAKRANHSVDKSSAKSHVASSSRHDSAKGGGARTR